MNEMNFIWNFLGPFITGLEYATDTTAEVVGKPEKSFFLSAVEEFNCQPNECIMIGDVIWFKSSIPTMLFKINLLGLREYWLNLNIAQISMCIEKM